MKNMFWTMLLTTTLAYPLVASAEIYRAQSSSDGMSYTTEVVSAPINHRDQAGVHYNTLDRTHIQAVQQVLRDNGFYRGTVDGAVDRQTEAAIAGFQSSKGLRPTGQLDQETVRRLGVVLSASDQVATLEGPLPNEVRSNRKHSAKVSAHQAIDGTTVDRKLVTLDRGEVSRIQQTLADNGYYRGRIDGLWGSATTNGLRSFQTANGLPATGMLNARTLSELGMAVDVEHQLYQVEPASGR